MQPKLFSLLTGALIFSAAILGWNQSGRAALCSKCRDLMFIDSEGKCSDCGGSTASGALKICPKCSARRHQCEHCLAPLTQEEEVAAQSKPVESKPAEPSPPERPRNDNSQSDGSPSGDAPDKSPSRWTPKANSGTTPPSQETAVARLPGPDIDPLPPAATSEAPAPTQRLPEDIPPAAQRPETIAPGRPKPINPAKAGTYTAGSWRYQMQIINPGTRSEGRWGWLTYDGQKLPRGDVNDYYNTPWGPVFWVDVPTTAWGLHGWMPVPLSQNRRQGRALTIPSSIISAVASQNGSARSQFPSPDSGGAAATSPRVQTLEINRSHNGQMARVRVGNVLVIRLPGNPATGYRWQASSTTSSVVRLTVRPQYSPPGPSSTGTASPGMFTFIFQAVQAGTGSIRLYYVNANDSGRPRDSFAVGVNVSPAATARTALPVSSQSGQR